MKLLIYTHPFAPKVGGVEAYVMSLAAELARGNSAAPDNVEVTVVTQTPADGFDDASLPFRVVRRPGMRKCLRLLREADVIHSAGPAFIPMVAGLMFRKALVVEHSGYQASCPNGLLLQEPGQTVCPGYFLAGRYHKCLRCNARIAGWKGSISKLLLLFLRRALSKCVDRNIAPSEHVARRIALPRTVTVYHGISQLSATGANKGASQA
jgi:glycosyltransferase involved in cell wall biosynthesis